MLPETSRTPDVAPAKADIPNTKPTEVTAAPATFRIFILYPPLGNDLIVSSGVSPTTIDCDLPWSNYHFQAYCELLFMLVECEKVLVLTFMLVDDVDWFEVVPVLVFTVTFVVPFSF